MAGSGNNGSGKMRRPQGRVKLRVLVMLAGISLIWLVIAIRWRPSGEVPPPPQSTTKSMLSSLEMAIEWSIMENLDDSASLQVGDSFQSLHEQLLKFHDYREFCDRAGYGTDADSVVDAWGQPIRLRSGVLYSIGANGIDEGGGGDDIRSRKLADLDRPGPEARQREAPEMGDGESGGQ